MPIQRIIIPCGDIYHSPHNGYEYCQHPETVAKHGHKPYCRPDPRTSAFTCPRGYPGHYCAIREDAEEEYDIEEEISAGRQATLEGF